MLLSKEKSVCLSIHIKDLARLTYFDEICQIYYLPGFCHRPERMLKVELETTADGSPTLYREDIDEHYHSVKGAFAESNHIYIHLGWKKAACESESIAVFEVGFGTGLNAVLTAQTAFENKVKTIYHSVELYPLPKETIDALAPFHDERNRDIFRKMHEASWNEDVEINPYFTLKKLQASLRTLELTPSTYDVVYFDAFAPEKQPEMWDKTIFLKLYEALKPGGILTTYCAKGAIRRMLQDIGFRTERLPGPPNGKREVLRATKL